MALNLVKAINMEQICSSTIEHRYCAFRLLHKAPCADYTQKKTPSFVSCTILLISVNNCAMPFVVQSLSFLFSRCGLCIHKSVGTVGVQVRFVHRFTSCYTCVKTSFNSPSISPHTLFSWWCSLDGKCCLALILIHCITHLVHLDSSENGFFIEMGKT